MHVTDDRTPCVVCGLVPARSLPVRRHVGMVLAQRFVKVQEPLCRDHGAAITKQYLGKTLLQGWWGLISVFVNVWVVAADLLTLIRYRKLDGPSGVPWANRPGGVVVNPDGGRPEAAWHADPTGRHELRWHDGAGWTARVSDAGATGLDPLVPDT